MRPSHRSRRTSALLAVGLVVVYGGLGVPTAAAAATPEPPAKYVNTTQCVRASDAGATLRNGVSWAQTQLDYTSVWDISDRGAGQTVAVIDTGVNVVAAFGNRVQRGGDYVVKNGDGHDDCDGHGTVVAGLIAAQPDGRSGFAGVAPSALVLPIRQSSSYYGVQNAKQGATDRVAGTTASLAQSIVYAVDRGATVINISEASCSTASAVPDQGTAAVAAAVRYALIREVVVVAAAGNVDSSTDCKRQNSPGAAPLTLPTPADVAGVLAVAAVDRAGRPAAFTLNGPWVGVAAPGVDIISTDPVNGSTGQINEFVSSAGVAPIQGTSFAAPYVAGLAALVRARFPRLSAAQVVDRITGTAVHPAAPGGRDDTVGFGMIDPVAALTAVVPAESAVTPAPRHGPALLPAAVERPDPDRGARRVGLVGALVVLVLLVAGAVAVATGSRSAAGGRRPSARGAARRGR